MLRSVLGMMAAGTLISLVLAEALMLILQQPWRTDFAGQVCRYAVERAISTPSTMKIRELSVFDWTGLMADTGHSVSIEFDADNAFGATVRHRAECRFAQTIERGQPIPELTEFTLTPGPTYSPSDLRLLRLYLRRKFE